MNLLERDTQELQQRCERIFLNELEQVDDSSQVPLIKGICSDTAPGAYVLYLLSFSGLHRKVRLFLEEMITQWLLPSANLQIVSFKSLIFNSPRFQHPLSYIEIVVPISDTKLAELVQQQLPFFNEELRKGVTSLDLANQVLESKRFSASSRSNLVYEAIFALMRRHPKRFSYDIFQEIQPFLADSKEDFRKIRDARLLCRIICAHYLLKKTLLKEAQLNPNRRHLSIKFLPTRVGLPQENKRVLGLAIAFNRISDFELLELRHIQAAVQRFVPQAFANPPSFYAHFHEERQFTTLYVEFEKLESVPFTVQEIKEMRYELADALNEEIEYLSPLLFIPRKEEDLLNMASLFKSPLVNEELPQAVISFEEQQRDRLRFQILLLPSHRTLPFTPFSRADWLPAHVRLLHHKTIAIGQGHYTKEIELLALELNSPPFLRANHSLDLWKARQSVCEALEILIGPFKDQSGAFIPQPISKDAMQRRVINKRRLRLHLPRAAQSLDPRSAADRTSGIVIRMLYEGLCRVNEEGQIELAIAQQVTPSSDGKQYLIKLKKTCWSNGSPLTARDFEYGWKKILDPAVQAPYSFLFFCIKNGEAAKKGDVPLKEVGIEVIDDLTLSVSLEHPVPFFKELLANWLFSPLCREMDQKHPGWAYHVGTTYISNGPFKLDLWKLNDELHLVKNPHYWEASKVELDQIEISVIGDEKKSLNLFLKGELDWLGDPLSKIDPQDIPSLKEKKILIHDPHNYGLFWLQMNLTKTPFQNRKIRKALAFGTNRHRLIHEVLHSEDLPAFGFATLKEKTFPPAFKDDDQEKALHYFNAGLKELGLTRKELPPLIFSHSELEEHIAITYALAEQWKQLFGLQIQFKKYLWNNYFESLFQKEHMIGGLVWYSRFKDPLYNYDLFIQRPHALSILGWKNSEYEKVVHLAKQATDEEKKMAHLCRAEQILLEEMPAIPLFYQHFRYLKNPSLQHYIISNMHQIDFRFAKFTKDKQ